MSITAQSFGDTPSKNLDKQFVVVGPQHYAFLLRSQGIFLDLDRVRRSSNELWGEFEVRVNGSFPDARTFGDGVLQAGDLNLSSVQARTSRAKILETRSANKTTDWYGLIEDFAVRVLAAERDGEPSVGLCDIEASEEGQVETWTVQGLPLLSDLPMVLFGDAAAAKSYLALWLAGTLAQRGIPVLYLDWEFSGSEHRKRLDRLFQPTPNHAVLRYRRCDRPLVRIISGVVTDIRKWSIQYVICDSIGFAIEGSPLDAEAATNYFAAVRRLNCGSLHLAHIAKHQEEGKDPTIFGSNFFKAGARSAWYIDRTLDNPEDEIRVGLYHRKFNAGRQQRKPLGYRITFDTHRTRIEPIDIEAVDELAAQLPLVQRLRTALADGPLSVKRLAEDLASTSNVVRAVVAKHKSSFIRTGDKIALLQVERGIQF